jgi:hypothetical protein
MPGRTVTLNNPGLRVSGRSATRFAKMLYQRIRRFCSTDQIFALYKAWLRPGCNTSTLQLETLESTWDTRT